MTTSAPLTRDEATRLARLKALAVLDTAPEPLFDMITAAAAAACGVQIALVTLIDGTRQWLKSNHGMPGISEISLDHAICAHAILETDVTVVQNLARDARFADNPIVKAGPQLRFYAGAPLRMSDGSTLGTLCVLDRKPRKLTRAQVEVLRLLADAVVHALEFREKALASLTAARLAEQRIEHLYRSTPAMLYAVDSSGRMVMVSDTWLAELGYEREQVLGHRSVDFLTEASRRKAVDEIYPAFYATGKVKGADLQMRRANGEVIDVLVSGVLERDTAGRPLRNIAVMENVTQRKRAERALLGEQARMSRILEGTNAGTWEWNIQSGETIINRRWAEIIGYAPAEIEPVTLETWSSHMHPDDLVRFRSQARAHFNGSLEVHEIDLRVRHKNGDWIWVQDRGRVSARTEEGRPLWMHGVRLDISAAKKAEQALRASRGFLKRTGDIAGVGGWEIDLITHKMTWSDETRRLHEVEPGYVPTTEEAIQFYAPSARPLIEAAFAEAINQGKSWDLELPLVSAKGRSFWARAVGSVEIEKGRAVRLVGAFQDVTARKEIEWELAESQQLLRVTLESIGDAVLTTNVRGEVQWLNPVAERLTGWGREEAWFKPLLKVLVLVDENTRCPIEDPVAACLAQRAASGPASPTLLIRRDGAEFGVEESVAPIRDAQGEILGAVVVLRDVSEQRRLAREMRHRATHDTLTGLVNRAEFEARLEQLLTVSAVNGRAGALLFIDLDQFKLVNDACGHAIGDELLRQVATILKGALRANDTVARLGGDEFGILLEDVSTSAAVTVAQGICNSMEQFRFTHEGHRFRVGASIGLVPLDLHWVSTSLALQAADSSCYAAKEAGRNRVHIWSDSDTAMNERHGEIAWVTRLERAFEEDCFELYAQRMLALDGRDATQQCEILLRLREADGALTLPGVLMRAAERFHMAARVDMWVLRRVFAWMEQRDSCDWQMVSVNLSGQSIGDRVFRGEVEEMIRRARFDVSKICLEITETAAITHIGIARRFFEQIRGRGVRIALDDFGAGASSFGYLKNLPIDFIKIDGQFVMNLLDQKLDRVAVQCFRDVADALGVKTIAECVERQDVLEALRAIGIDYAQGFLLHRPEPLDCLLPCPQEAST